MMLQLKTKAGKTIDEVVKPDAEEGGLVLEAKDLSATDFGNTIPASLHGYWGFEKYDGPAFRLENTHAQHWELTPADREALIVGREDTIHLAADDASCVDTILVKDSAGKEMKADWTATAPDQVAVKVPLKQAHPGPLMLEVKQYGTVTAQTIPLRAFSEAGHLASFTLHAGDAQGMLKGSRLDDVANLTLNGVTFLPEKVDATMGSDELPMMAKDAKAAAKLKQGETGQAQVALTDGRILDVDVAVGAPRPDVQLIGKSVQASASSTGSNIQLADQDELPQDAKLTFSLRAESPANFSRSEQIEVATEDEAFSTTLSLDNGGMTLENSKVALATLDPAKAFGGSAFGPLKFRTVENGTAGDWQPLATLVRLPVLHDLKCPADAGQECRLSGSNLFLVDAVANDQQFANPVQVPDGFPGYVLPVPRPEDGQLFLKLRDDPTVVNQVTLTAENLAPPPGEMPSRHATRAAYHEGERPPAPGSKRQTGAPPSAAPSPQTAPSVNTPAAPPASGSPSNGSKPGSAPSTTEPQPAPQPQNGASQNGARQNGGNPPGPSASGTSPQGAGAASSPNSSQPQSGADTSPQQP